MRKSRASCIQAKRVLKTLKEKKAEREYTVLEQRIALVEICRNMSSPETVKDMDDAELPKHLFHIQRNKSLKLRFDVKLALVDRAARSSLEAWLKDGESKRWPEFVEAWALGSHEITEKFDGQAPRLSALLRDLVQDYDAVGFLGEDDAEDAGQDAGDADAAADERERTFGSQCKATADRQLSLDSGVTIASKLQYLRRHLAEQFLKIHGQVGTQPLV